MRESIVLATTGTRINEDAKYEYKRATCVRGDAEVEVETKVKELK